MSLPAYENSLWILDRLTIRFAVRTQGGVQQTQAQWYAHMHRECDPWSIVTSNYLFENAKSTTENVVFTIAQSGATSAGASLPVSTGVLKGVWNAEMLDIRVDGKKCTVETVLWKPKSDWTDVVSSDGDSTGGSA